MKGVGSMKKRVACLLVFMISCGIFAQNVLRNIPYEKVKYLEKIRWTELNYDDAALTSLRFNFQPLEDIKKYYKVRYYYKDRTVIFDVIGCEGDKFYSMNRPTEKTTSFPLQGDGEIGSLQENTRRIRVDDENRLDGLYVPIDTSNLVAWIEIKSFEEGVDYVGSVSLGYEEYGTHLVKYDASSCTFYSDSLFGNNYEEDLAEALARSRAVDRPVRYYELHSSPWNNDRFEIKIKNLAEFEECLEIKTEQYVATCYPTDYLLVNHPTAGSFNYLENDIYDSPNGKIIKQLSYGSLTIVDYIQERIVVKNKYAIWLKIQTRNNTVGWVSSDCIYINRDRWSYLHPYMP